MVDSQIVIAHNNIILNEDGKKWLKSDYEELVLRKGQVTGW
jgi:hypothetical protein